jgi:pimeloyl-ACP methyl ester carboxylesterase
MRRKKHFLTICALLIVAGACAPQPSPTPTTTAREITVNSNGVAQYVRVSGNPSSGNVLIAIHGGPGMTSDYMLNLEKLAGPDLAVVNYDQRGTGRSSSPQADPDNYTLEQYAEDLDAVRRATGVESIHLFGHSWGGIVAQRYASLHPEHVRSLILMGSGPPTREQTLACQDAIRQRIIELMQQGIISENPESNASGSESFIQAYFSDPNFWFSADDLGSAPLIDEGTEQVSDLTWTANASFNLTADLAELNLRVLNLWGDDDPARPVANPAILAALPNAEVETVVFSHCGHFWHECPEQFFNAMRAFLSIEEAKE